MIQSDELMTWTASRFQMNGHKLECAALACSKPQAPVTATTIAIPIILHLTLPFPPSAVLHKLGYEAV